MILINHPSKEDVEKFWNNWWDRTIKSFDGEDGWDLAVRIYTKSNRNCE